MLRKKVKLVLIILMLSSFFLILYCRRNYNNYWQRIGIFNNKKLLNYQEYTSPCDCRDEKVFVNEYEDDPDIEVVIPLSSQLYRIPKRYLSHLTCDPFNTFKRGKHQKIISFSLYGKDNYYYRQLKGMHYKHDGFSIRENSSIFLFSLRNI